MGRQRWKKKQKANGDEGGGEQWEKREQGPDPSFRVISLHPSAPLCAVAIGGHLRVIDYSTGTVHQLASPATDAEQLPNCIRSLDFSADSKHLLSGGDDKTVRIWSTRDWSCVASFKAPKKISAAVFTRDSQYALFADKFGDVLVSHVAAAATGSEAPAPSLLLGHLSAIITSITVSPDNKLVVSTDKDGKVRVSILPPQPLKGAYEVQSYCLGHAQFVTSAAFVSGVGGYLLATGSGDGTVRLWDPLTGECLDSYVASAERQEEGGEGGEGGEAAAEAAASDGGAGQEQASGSADEGEEEVEEEQEQEQQRPRSNCAAVLCVAASPDGSTLAAAIEGEGGLLLLSCSHQQRKLELAQRLELPGVAHPCGAAFDSKGRLWAAGGVPVQTSQTVHVAVAQRSSSSKQYEVCSGEVLADAASLAALELRSPQEEQQLEGDQLPSYFGHLKKRTYDAEEQEARKKHRNDRKEAVRLAQLRGAAS